MKWTMERWHRVSQWPLTAGAVAFLASDEAAQINGQTIAIDGARSVS